MNTDVTFPRRRWTGVVAGLLVLLSLGCGGAQAQSAEIRLVLVSGSRSPLETMLPSEARRLFLGVPFSLGGHEVSALRLIEPQVQEVFLQRALFMSLNAYERQIAAHTFRTGRRKPLEVATPAEAAEALAADPYAVSYMPEDEARARNLKIIGRL
jgi:hypothetical protein